MKKIILIAILSIPLLFTGCNDTKRHTSASNEEITLEVTLERNLTSVHPLDIIVKLTNLGEHTVYYDNSAFPDADGYISNNFFTVLEDGVEVGYKGILISKCTINFTSIAPGETKTGRISLDRYYQVHQGTHQYQISHVERVGAKTVDGKAEAYDDACAEIIPNALPPGEYTSIPSLLQYNTLEFEATLHTIRELIYKSIKETK